MALKLDPACEEARKGFLSAEQFAGSDLEQRAAISIRDITLCKELDWLGKNGFWVKESHALKEPAENSAAVNRQALIRQIQILTNQLRQELFLREEQRGVFCKKKIDAFYGQCRANGAKLFLISYPLATPQYVIDAAKEYKQGFIDVQPDFINILNADNLNEYFVSDGHCTALGYGVIARKISEVLLREVNEN
ncbi:MAG: hypothetical protein HY810_04650 [Candidatus Omnitrophica bacterium]|nr:hypothetical protein [Candidatus Omnitrophota bacterium]